jgi:GDPmannose 4,6-dehydratase
VGIVENVYAHGRKTEGGGTGHVAKGDVIVRVDPRYFRPTEVETLLGDPTKAKEKLGWTPQTSFEDLVSEMVRSDFEAAQRDQLCRRHGFSTFNYHE